MYMNYNFGSFKNEDSVIIYSSPCWWKEYIYWASQQTALQYSPKQLKQMETTKKKNIEQLHKIQVSVNLKIPTWFEKTLFTYFLNWNPDCSCTAKSVSLCIECK